MQFLPVFNHVNGFLFDILYSIFKTVPLMSPLLGSPISDLYRGILLLILQDPMVARAMIRLCDVQT